MKKIYFLFLVLSCASQAQVKGSFLINWKEDSAYLIGESKYFIPQFDYENFFFDEVNKTLEFRLNAPSNSEIDEGSIRITNIVYENINQIGDLAPIYIGNSILAQSKSVISRDKFFAQISFAPIIKTNSGYQRVKSFDYSVERSNSSSLLSKGGFNGLSNSVLSNGDWYRFYVDKSGVYKLSKAFLQQLGLNLNNINPKNIKIYGNGGRMIPLSNAVDYPSDLEENSIQIVGEEDGSFERESRSKRS